MNKLTPKSLLITAFAAVVLGSAAAFMVMAILFFPSQKISAADDVPSVAIATVTPTPIATLAPTPTPTAAPTPTPKPVIRSSAIRVVAAVKPVQPTGLPLICQSQSYTPEREAQCPNSGPVVRTVSFAALDSPATTAAQLPPVASPAPTLAPTTAPTPTPTPTATATPTPSSSPTLTPIPTPTATPTPRDCGDYPVLLCGAARDSLVDPWGMYNRECVSYTAYKISTRRTMPYWGGHGNASQWPDNARAIGIPVDGTPKVGDVAVLMTGVGHTMYVEAVLGDTITVSQFNYNNTGEFSQMTVPWAGLTFIHF